MVIRILRFILARSSALVGCKLVPKTSRLILRPGLDSVSDQIADPRGKLIVFDVGANLGQTISAVLERFPAANIWAFEPSEATCKELRKRVGHLDQVIVSQKALGSQPGMAILQENSHPTMSSILGLGSAGWGEVKSNQSVGMTTVDEFCAEKKIEHIDLLKTDTQGYELEVLKGASGMIQRRQIKMIYLELIFSDMYEGMPPYYETIRYLVENGFTLAAMTDFHYQDGALGWADALFVRKEDLPSKKAISA